MDNSNNPYNPANPQNPAPGAGPTPPQPQDPNLNNPYLSQSAPNPSLDPMPQTANPITNTVSVPTWPPAPTPSEASGQAPLTQAQEQTATTPWTQDPQPTLTATETPATTPWTPPQNDISQNPLTNASPWANTPQTPQSIPTDPTPAPSPTVQADLGAQPVAPLTSSVPDASVSPAVPQSSDPNMQASLATPNPSPWELPTQTQNAAPSEPMPTFPPQTNSQLGTMDAALGSAPMQPLSGENTENSQPPAWSPSATTDNSSAPTDLSHLITNNPSDRQPQQMAAETLVVPSTIASGEVPSLPGEGHKGIPKWVIGVGIGLLILVAGASAYFILGIGQAPEESSAPATEVQTQVRPPQPVATAAPVVQPTPEPATGSANFGALEGSGTQQATSAADLIRLRQQQAQ